LRPPETQAEGFEVIENEIGIRHGFSEDLSCNPVLEIEQKSGSIAMLDFEPTMKKLRGLRGSLRTVPTDSPF
jgi:hypothetical protein